VSHKKRWMISKKRLYFIGYLHEFDKREKSSTVNNCFIILLSAVVFWLAVSLYAADDGVQVVKGFSYPDYDEHGNLKFKLVGDEAKIQADGLIQVKNLEIVFYEDGEITTRVTTPWCMFNRETRVVTSTSTVSISRSEIVLNGKGFEWNAEQECFNIRHDAEVVLRRSRNRLKQEDSP